MGFGFPGRLSTRTIPIAPAAFARSAFEVKVQSPRETRTIAPSSECDGNGCTGPFGFSGGPQRCRSTGWPPAPTIEPTSTSVWSLTDQAAGVDAFSIGICLSVAGALGAVTESAGAKMCVFVTAATVIAAGALPGDWTL